MKHGMIDVIPNELSPLELLQGLGVLKGLLPVDGSELEDAVSLPGRQEGSPSKVVIEP
jgi:hypothetical protein